MDVIGDALLMAFSTVTLAAAAFFAHKVLWLVRYKQIQQRIVGASVRRLREGNGAEIAAWEDFARTCWQNALGNAAMRGPSHFIRRVEDGLALVRGDLRGHRVSLETLLVQVLASAKPAAGPPAVVLALRRLSPGRGDERYEVVFDRRIGSVSAPRPPDKHLYELKTKSRYGMVRRALVFFSGAADVFCSSQHVAVMSQNVHVPTSLLVRRLSLVFLIVLFVLLDMAFQLRKAISMAIQTQLWGPVRVGAGGDSGFHGMVSFALGFGVWLALYGSIYLTIYLAIRRRYEVHRRRLRGMFADETLHLEGIHRGHLAALVQWGGAYGRSLDGAVEITVRHAEQLIDHYAHRLRRRVAGPALLEAVKTIADCLFLRLPESKGELQDVATTHRHSLWHHAWPRPEEMDYQVRLAEYRAAWQHLVLAVNDLRRQQPDPVLAQELWLRATLYARVFAPLLPSGMGEDLAQAYAQMVTECVAATDRDLIELDRRLGELQRSLSEQIEAAHGLIEGRVELANGQIEAAVAARSAEIIHVREQARLEAMAFEI